MLFKQNVIQGEDIAVIKSLIGRNINPILREVQGNNPKWQELKTGLLNLATRINNHKLSQKIGIYLERNSILSNTDLLFSLGKRSFDEKELTWEERKTVDKELRQSRLKMFETYLAIMRHINTLRNRRRIRQWLRLA